VKVVEPGVVAGRSNPRVVAALAFIWPARTKGFAGTDIFRCRKLWLEDKARRARGWDIGFVGRRWCRG